MDFRFINESNFNCLCFFSSIPHNKSNIPYKMSTKLFLPLSNIWGEIVHLNIEVLETVLFLITKAFMIFGVLGFRVYDLTIGSSRYIFNTLNMH